MNENMTYVPSRLTSAKTNKVVAGANEILDDDINLKQDVINMLSKKVIDLNSVPTSSTLTYTVNNVTCNFKVGDEVRVADQESETGYTFYKLYELTTEEGVTTATWDKLGAGGASPVNPNETINISLTQVGGDSADLIGSTVTITDDDSGDTLFTDTWNGSTITAEIEVNTNYTISVETIAGYLACEPQSYLAGYQTIRDIHFQYIASGAFVEATDGTLYRSTAWNSSGKIANAVVLITDACKIRIALTKTKLPVHNAYISPLENYLSGHQDIILAELDYDNEGNTDKLIQFNIAYGTNTTSYAAPYCRNFSFSYPSGKKGSMPAFGCLKQMGLNITEINNCLSVCNGSAIASEYMTSSTYGYTNHNNARGMWTYPNYCCAITDSYEIRPVTTYE